MSKKVEEGTEPEKTEQSEKQTLTPAEETRILIDKSEEAGAEKFIPAEKLAEQK